MPPKPAAGGARLRDRVCKAPSRIHGYGVFAKVDLQAGEYIGTYLGPSARRNGVYVLWVYAQEGEPPLARSGRNLLRWLNHQQDGNAEFDGFELYALRKIQSGEEITFEYSGGAGLDEAW